MGPSILPGWTSLLLDFGHLENFEILHLAILKQFLGFPSLTLTSLFIHHLLMQPYLVF